MQTFLPYPGFVDSARVLDNKRLGKQRVETLQLLNRNSDWRHHSASRMWEGYHQALVLYGCIMCHEWIRRGFKDTTLDKIRSYDDHTQIILPPWMYVPEFHASHRSNLLRKNPEHYGQFGWTEGPDLPYFWPVVK